MSNDRVHIQLKNGREALQLVQSLSDLEDSFTIENQSGARRVNAKSVLGVIYTVFHFADGLYLVNNTHAGCIPDCVKPFLFACT